MQKVNSFFLFASGADVTLLKDCPTEQSKYVGIGATIFFTGIFAALAAAYALFTVFDNYFIAIALGLLWGLMIFNLDRYIVSSMRKDSRFWREFTTASPRLMLAIAISLVIAKPLELKIFEKEIEPELVVMEQQAYARQEAETMSRYEPAIKRLKAEINTLKSEMVTKSIHRDELTLLAQQEADGTGGSMRRNLGPIYKLKKADAEQAEHELQELTASNTRKIDALESQVAKQDSLMNAEMASLTRSKLNGPAARLEALSRLTAESSAIWWANLFIVLLFIIVESAPILVKLISKSGPYDSLLHITEHGFLCKEVETVAITAADTKQRTSTLPETEQGYVARKLDAELG
jgi:phage host-nuclease inhibitor protein Gam